MKINRSELKNYVKQSMRCSKPNPILVTLAFLLVTGVGEWLLSTLFGALSGMSSIGTQYLTLLEQGGDPEQVMQTLLMQMLASGALARMVSVSLIMTALICLWQMLMNVGYTGYTISVVMGENPTLGRIFCGFPLIGKVLVTGVLTGLFLTLWTLLFTVVLIAGAVVAGLLMESATVAAVILILVAYVGFFAGMIWVSLRYALVNHLVVDRGLSGLEAIRTSKSMMKGNKGSLLMLHLSFLGWYLLEVVLVLLGFAVIAVTTGVQVAQLLGGSTFLSLDLIGGVLGTVSFVLVLVSGLVYIIELWLYPYVNCAVSAFYKTLTGQFPPRPEAPAVAEYPPLFVADQTVEELPQPEEHDEDQ